MKMNPDTGPQILPASFGPSEKVNLDLGPQINPGPGNDQFTPYVPKGATDPLGPQINPGPGLTQLPKVNPDTGPQINPGPGDGWFGGLFRPRVRAQARTGDRMQTVRQTAGFFPAATGLPGEPNIRTVDSWQGGPGGTANRFGIRNGWTHGF